MVQQCIIICIFIFIYYSVQAISKCYLKEWGVLHNVIALCTLFCILMISSWYPHDILMLSSCYPHDILILFSCYPHVILMLSSCYPHVILMLSSCYSHVILMLPSCYPHVILMLFSCYPHVILMLSSCYPHAILMLSSCYPHDILMLSSCYPHDILMLSSCYPHVILMISSGPYSSRRWSSCSPAGRCWAAAPCTRAGCPGEPPASSPGSWRTARYGTGAPSACAAPWPRSAWGRGGRDAKDAGKCSSSNCYKWYSLH